jgi:hypothetical protein
MLAAVVSYHTNPYTCGVARFNHGLARALGVPLLQLDEFLVATSPKKVLLSLKTEEMDTTSLDLLRAAIQVGRITFDLFLHASDGSSREHEFCMSATRVFAASAEIASKISAIRSDVVACFAPGAPVLPRQASVDCTLLTFGMAHKIRSEGYRRLATLLEGDPRTFCLEISTALHEGGSFDASFFTINAEISAAFAGNVRFLGFLADAEVSRRLREVDALVAFFPRGVRENNTTVLSAMTHGCPVITNLDAHSPQWMVHGSTLFDVSCMPSFPEKSDLRAVGDAGMRAAERLNFEHLTEILAPKSE